MVAECEDRQERRAAAGSIFVVQEEDEVFGVGEDECPLEKEYVRRRNWLGRSNGFEAGRSGRARLSDNRK